MENTLDEMTLKPEKNNQNSNNQYYRIRSFIIQFPFQGLIPSPQRSIKKFLSKYTSFMKLNTGKEFFSKVSDVLLNHHVVYFFLSSVINRTGTLSSKFDFYYFLFRISINLFRYFWEKVHSENPKAPERPFVNFHSKLIFKSKRCPSWLQKKNFPSLKLLTVNDHWVRSLWA